MKISCAGLFAAALLFGAGHSLALASFYVPSETITATFGGGFAVHRDVSCQGDPSSVGGPSKQRAKSGDASRTWATAQELVDPWVPAAPRVVGGDDPNLAVDSELADPWSKTALAVATVNTAPATNPFNNGLVDPWPAPRADYDLHDIVDPWAAPN